MVASTLNYCVTLYTHFINGLMVSFSIAYNYNFAILVEYKVTGSQS